MSYAITRTEDFYPLSLLYRSSGLEVTPATVSPPGTVALWRCDDPAQHRLLAAATLQRRAGHVVLAHLAVTASCRGTGLGSRLLAEVEAEAARLGVQTCWLVGKVPGFYQRVGWEVVPPEQAPPISRCLSCLQFQVDCFPSVMRKTLVP